MKHIWAMTANEVVAFLGSSSDNGLSLEDAVKRSKESGPNRLKEEKSTPPWLLFLLQFNNFIIWVLIAAAFVSGYLGEWIDAGAIIMIIALNAILGFVQEFHAQSALAALKKLSSPNSKVIRSAMHKVISSSDIVCGDLIEIEAGDHIPADGRVVWTTSNFTVQESSLTGESSPVTKTSFALQGKDIPLADRANMVYASSSVTSGRARILITAIGMDTEIGKIAGMIAQVKREETPLQKKLAQFGHFVVLLCFILVGLVFALELYHGGDIVEVFLSAVSLAVAAIPEGLPAVVTIALALGVGRMVKRNVLIRKLPSVETLGCATVICSDKTGTLTKNEMTAQAVFTGGNVFKVSGIGYEPRGGFFLNDMPVDMEKEYPYVRALLECGVLCNGAQLHREKGVYKVIGDPTEGALLSLAGKAGIDKNKLEESHIFIEEIPFDSERKMMTVLRREKQKVKAFIKGAPDVLLRKCKHIYDRGRERTMDQSDLAKILDTNDYLAANAMRVLAFACRELSILPSRVDAQAIESDLTFIGLVAMIDPARPEVKAAIERCKEAGIKTVMITGDHKNTAVAIAKELGIFESSSIAFTGEELDNLTSAEFRKNVENTTVYARVSPEHKVRIVKAWRERGDVVAMTGDGVNDAPAIKEADIGVAMGITGTDVTKEVADMVVTDDNFVSIVAAVEEGRGIYANIKKFIHYLLSCNIGEILVMLCASILNFPVPLLPVHILWINLVTDSFPALALGVDPVDKDIMKIPPRLPQEPVVGLSSFGIMFLHGAVIALCSLAAFSFVRFVECGSLHRARTAAFIVLACSQLVHAFNCRNQKESIFKIGIFSNIYLICAVLAGFILQLIVVYAPFCQMIFKTEALGFHDWVLVLFVSVLPLVIMEMIKFATACHKQKIGRV